jgi:hypothetical protein
MVRGILSAFSGISDNYQELLIINKSFWFAKILEEYSIYNGSQNSVYLCLEGRC